MFLMNVWICLLVGLCMLLPTAGRIKGLKSEAVAAEQGGSELIDPADAEVDKRQRKSKGSKSVKRGKLHKKSKGSKPAWWDTVHDQLAGSAPLEKCRRRKDPPSNGARCGKKPKTCFFGHMECNGRSVPETKCVCNDTTWVCEEQFCPLEEGERGPLEVQMGPLEGQRDPSKGQTDSLGGQTASSCPVVITNPMQCPEIPPPNFGGGSCTPQQLGGVPQKHSCEWGQEECCGKCYPSFGCTCFPNESLPNGIWRCVFTDACITGCDEFIV